MLLCDIGNTRAKFYHKGRLWSVDIDTLDAYKDERVCYISVNDRVVIDFCNWIDLEPYVELKSDYEGLGVDRKVLCNALEDGVVVDAGSAITVDVMERGVHKGGFIVPGFRAGVEALKSISPRLELDPDWSVDLRRLPSRTKEALEYGLIAPLVSWLEKFEGKLYLTGGDAPVLAKYLNAVHDPALIFKGMENIIQRKALC